MAGISARQLAEFRRPCFLQGNMDLEFLTAADWGSCFARNKDLAVETLVEKGNQSTKKNGGKGIPLVKKMVGIIRSPN